MTASVGQVTETNPIVNNPFREPSRFWHFSGDTPELREGRRQAGYLPPSPKHDGAVRITDEAIELKLINDLRDRVRQWRSGGYPGATRVTRDLFDFWFDDERGQSTTRPFFAQQEAIETIAFLTEASSDRLVGIEIPKRESFLRLGTKMATGTGKTLVMALIIAWCGLNKASNRQDRRYSDAFLVVCPNLTVLMRLTGREGLIPSEPESAFEVYDLIPRNMSKLIGQIKVQVINWHKLAPFEDPEHSIVQRGAESDSAFVRRVLDRPIAKKERIVVLNDEAHHAWRLPSDLVAKATGADRRDAENATVWVDGLAKIHRANGILRCHDLSATPMYPGIAGSLAWAPFEWVISDFALVDAIESGLVKIPRVPTDDNTGRAAPKYRNLWSHIATSLPKRGQEDASEHPLMDYLAEADGPLKQLAGEWEEAHETWQDSGRTIPPVLVVICHNTTMARLLERHIAELGEASPLLRNSEREPHNTVRIDSTVLDRAENRNEASKIDAEEDLRQLVATVGKEGKPGEQVRCLVSVAMLAEGWSANNVTQILGLRAFQSQLLCEQVIGRGLRRTDYSDLSRPEYVDVYGVPFQLLPFANQTNTPTPDPPPATLVRSVEDRAHLRLEFPRVVSIVHDVDDVLEIDLDSIEPVRVSAKLDPTSTFVAFETGSITTGMGGETQNRERAYESFRTQRLAFRIAARLVEPYQRPWLFPQALSAVRQVLDQKIDYEGEVDEREICNLRYLTLLTERISTAIRQDKGTTGKLLPVLDEYEPVGSTSDIAFYTTKKCVPAIKSHLSHTVCDSTLETKIAQQLERLDTVTSYAKNDRLFLEIPYRFLGRTRRYRPDFIAKLLNGEIYLIEGKGVPTEADDAKTTAARRWVDAVNATGQHGSWHHVICREPDIIPHLLGPTDEA